MKLLATIENELRAVAGEIPGAVHDVLAKHLTFTNITAHVLHEATTIDNDPLVQAAEAVALPAPARVAIAELLTRLDNEFAKLAQYTPPPAEPLATPSTPVEPLPDPVADAQAS